MDAMAAQTQVEFAQQTDSQLTQGSASLIHNVPNAPVGPLPAAQSAPSSSQGVYNVAQYTPSAQEAATGAYSAPRQQTCPPQTQQQPAATAPQNRMPAQPQPSASARRRTGRPRRPSATLPSRAILRPRAPLRPLKQPQPQQPLETQEAESRPDHHRNRTHGSGTRAAQSAAAARPLGARPARSQSVEPARRSGDAVAGHRERL